MPWKETEPRTERERFVMLDRGPASHLKRIAQRGKPVAELRPIQPEASKAQSKRGDMARMIWVAEDFCEPIEEMWEYME